MYTKTVSSVVLVLLVTSMVGLAFNIQSVKAGTIVVPDDYPTIQEGINNANEGDTVFVRNGTYYENVVVNTTIKLVGECWENTTIDGRKEHVGENAIRVAASNVLVCNFTVQNWNNGIYGGAAGTTYQQNLIRDNTFGIRLQSCTNNNFSDNIFIDNYFGLLISSSSEHITMRRNTFTNNVRNLCAGMGDDAGISSTLAYDIDDSNTINGKPIYYLVNARNFKVPTNAGFVAAINSSNITIEELDLTSNGIGILLVRSSNCYIADVNATDNDDCDISLVFSDNNTITGNLINSTANGIKIWFSDNNTISLNVVKNCGYGIVLHGMGAELNSSNTRNEISQNFLINNLDGIHLGGFCLEHVVERNTLIGNYIAISSDWNGNIYRENTIVRNGVGFYEESGRGNGIVHNNFIDNKQQVLPPGTNVWDAGYPSGGNYWSDYNGSDAYNGLFQNVTGSDGIGDTPYEVDTENNDWYPLMKPWVSFPPSTVVNASIRAGSRAFNLGCKWGWIKAYFEFPMGYNVADINASTVRINGTVTCDPTFLDACFGDANGLPELELRFNRTTLAQFMISQNPNCCNTSLKITGQLYSLRSFDGSVDLQISSLQGDADCDGKVTDHDVSLLASAYHSRPSDSNWNENVDIDSNGALNLSDLVLLTKHYGQ